MSLHRLLTLVSVACLLGPGTLVAEQLTLVNKAELRESLKDLHGKVVLVNFWASWCSPCLKEIPVLMQLQSELDPQKFQLVAVSLDDANSADAMVRPFMQKWFPEFRSYLSQESDMDDTVSIIDAAWNEVLPTTYLLDRNGSVKKRIQGSYTKDEFSDAILPLL